jgi:hypothetical protein
MHLILDVAHGNSAAAVRLYADIHILGVDFRTRACFTLLMSHQGDGVVPASVVDHGIRRTARAVCVEDRILGRVGQNLRSSVRRVLHPNMWRA